MHYSIAPDTQPHYIAVEARLTDITLADVDLQLPAWRPGRYELQNFAKNIQRFTVVDAQGNTLPFRKISKDCWRVQTNGATELTARYNYYGLLPIEARLNAGSSFVNDTLLYVNPVNLCLYAEGRIGEPCTLTLDIPDNWTVATSLTQTNAGHWTATDFYELVDCPIMTAPAMQHITYTVQDILFHVWVQGGRRPDGELVFDPAQVVSDFERFTARQLDLFGEFPERDYHFMTIVLPVSHYHGVEHRNSTMLVLGPNTEEESGGLYVDLLGVASHELFHTWNIIRIRPAELLPYNFTRETYFETCFVAEGVTTYYGDLMLRQSGVFDDVAYLKELQVTLKRHFEQNGRAAQSLVESSYDLWLDGYEKGVPDRKVSVYQKGAIAALILDLHIRKLSNHARSLDDVMRRMWADFGRPFVGYTLTDYRMATEIVAGESLNWYYDLCIFGNQPLNNLVNAYLNWVGLHLVYESASLEDDGTEKPAGYRLLELDDATGAEQRARWLNGHEAIHSGLIPEKTVGTPTAAK
ncbi:MAG: M61 family metallopeptidase [Spirosoma sp.]|nr:M61 family metallopeptidase [Spirosoma sp.]